LLTLAAAILWLWSLRLQDASIADIAWGPGFALTVWIASQGLFYWGLRSVLVLVLVTVWAVRLGTHIYVRHAGEDRRYAAMREKYFPTWWWRSLIQVFLLQAVLIWLVSWPLQFAVVSPRVLSTLDVIGFIIAACGLLLEATADWQLSIFRKDTRNKSKVMDQGVWRWSRHPNYFGDCMMWWGFFLVGLGAGAPGWIIISPLTMTLLLLKVSGVSLLEDDIIDRRPAYAKYIRQTSAFIPWPKKKRKS
jgi:steroid 5-alpha reductase family enzyme